MSKLNGLDLVAELRNAGIYIPFVFITAHEEYILDALRKRAADYLLKPVSLEVLRSTIDQFREVDFNVQAPCNGNDEEYQDDEDGTEESREAEVIAVFAKNGVKANIVD